MTHGDDHRSSDLIMSPISGDILRETIDRASREFQIRDVLDNAWALRPADFKPDVGALTHNDTAFRPLSDFVDAKLDVADFLRLAIAVARAVGLMHASGLVHRDIRPDNLLINDALDTAWITGFSNASRLPRERRSSIPPEMIDGSFAYMAPEQTGRMNRSVDTRSDLYSLGVTFYQLLTGCLPFSASDPSEWIHCHVARQPVHPQERSPEVPEALASILLRLMEKPAEARYQTARGLEHDIQICLDQLHSQGSITPFELARADFSTELTPPEKLYGRDREIGVLIAALTEMVETGYSRLVLVSGFSGIGKTSVVNELQRELVPVNGLFAAGKFDQFKRDIPYSSIAEAFRGVVLQLLAKDDADLERWRDNFARALGANGELMVNLIPELELIIGKQPPVPVLSGPEAQSRLVSVFRSFVDVFAQPEHPLVLFIDDLQWLDPASLDLFTHLGMHEDVRHLLLVGAYRDNEVRPDHPLTLRLNSVRAAGRPVREIALGGMAPDDVRSMLAEVLACDTEVVQPFASTVFRKAGGNPFFVLQFIAAVADERLLVFDEASTRWSWDIERIEARNITDNVVDLMVERLARLSDPSLQAIKMAACVGNTITIDRLHNILGMSARETEDLLRDALRMGLLLRVDANYAFAHDRVQEAAYAMFAVSERAKAHSRIGNLLLQHHRDDIEEWVFDIVDQFNRSDLHEEDREARRAAAALNLRAGVKARAASAYTSAVSYLDHGLQHLGDERWAAEYDLTFELSHQRAECTFLSGALDRAGEMVVELLGRASNPIHSAVVFRLKVELHLVQSDNVEAARSGLAGLRLFGIDFPEHPSQVDAERELEALETVLHGRAIEQYTELPTMSDPEMLAAMRLLAELWPPSFFTDFNLTIMVACRMVAISFRHGIAPSSNQGLAMFGWIMGPAFGRYDEGYEVVRMACGLAENQGAPLDMARVYNTMSLTSSWTRPLSSSIDWYRTAYRVCIEAGDVFFACFPCAFIGVTLLQRGRDLHAEAPETVELFEAARRTGFRDGSDMALVPERASACLRGLTASISDFSDGAFDQAAFERDLGGARAPTVAWFYWTRKVMLHYLAGEFDQAAHAYDQVVTGTCRIVQIEHLDYHFYGALTFAALISQGANADPSRLRERFDACEAQLAEWAEQTDSPTFAGKHVLILAEAAGLDRRHLRAQELYEESIRLSEQNEFLQDQAVAYEAASRHYAARGFEKIAITYLKEARRCFSTWGADAKVKLLDDQLPSSEAHESPTRSAASSVSADQFDLATVMRVSQAMTSEMVPERLVDTIMRASIEHAAAERAILLLDSGAGAMEVSAEASTMGAAVTVVQGLEESSAETRFAKSAVLYATRTNGPVVLGDASADGVFADDPHVRRNRVRSMICLPLMNQGNRVGLLYLENNLSPNVFTPNRLTILSLLASQAAAALERTRLHRDLEEREARIRRLVDSNIIGIVIWDRNGQLLDANDSFLNMTQYTKEDLARGLGWFEMTPPDWREQVVSELQELTTTGAMQPREKEYFRRDGTRVKVLIGAAAFDAEANQGVAYILDLTAREEAERKAVESEQRFRELQSELAHANRVETVGQLSTWIAHDVRQPLVGIVTSASAGLQWLSAEPPNIEAAGRSLQRVEEEGLRAAAILDKIRALMKRSTPFREVVNINDLVLSTLPLLQSEVRHRSVQVKVNLTKGSALVSADRVQLQQVMMNMMVNAIDAMSASSSGEKTITIETTVDDDGNVVTSVRDTGPLLPSEEYERFFEAFYSTKQDGLGIGLAICKKIVEDYGGKIWGEPCVPHGTDVKFLLPGLGAQSCSEG